MLTLEAFQNAIKKITEIPEYKEGAPNKVRVEHYAYCLPIDHQKQKIEVFECCRCDRTDKYSYIAVWEEGGSNEKFLIIPEWNIVSVSPLAQT